MRKNYKSENSGTFSTFGNIFQNADRRPNDDPVCRICGARYMSIEDLAFHLASQHKPDKKQKKRSKPKTAPTPVSKKPLVPSNSSAANQKSGPITFEPLVSVIFMIICV